MKKLVLHLERKYCSKTETFIYKQVKNIDKYDVLIATIQHMNNFPLTREIIVPQSVLRNNYATKYLSPNILDDLYNQLKVHDISLIHIHYLTDAYYFLRLLKKFNVPKIVSLYGYDISSFPHSYFGLAKYLLKKVFPYCDYFLVMSEDMKKDLIKLGCPENKIIIHFCGIKTQKFEMNKKQKTDNEKINILTIGTIEEKKAQHLVTEALSILNSKYGITNFNYIVVGTGNIKKIEDISVKSGIRDKIQFLGYVKYLSDEYLEIYKNADIFVLPSITTKNFDKEGIPIVIIEAMASGLPVLSTRHAGIPYIIENESNGLLVKEKDVDALTFALSRLISDPELRNKLGKNAQKKAVSELGFSNKIKELEQIYDMALENHSMKNST